MCVTVVDWHGIERCAYTATCYSLPSKDYAGIPPEESNMQDWVMMILTAGDVHARSSSSSL